jgi:hypothetical protein
MESRLIFLHRCYCDGVTEKARRAAAVLFKVVGRVSWQIRRSLIPRSEYEELRFPKSLMPRFQEKPLSFR